MPDLLIDDTENVRTLTLNRPDSLNSLTSALKEELRDALRAAATDDSVRAVVLTGSGKAFCAGQDLKEHVELLGSGDEAPFRTVEEHYNPIVTAITTMPKPVIAAVNGTAAGAGASLAYASDLRIAAASAKFVLSFGNIGLSADSGASFTLPRLIGYGRAMEMMLLGKPVDAARALEIGMVTEVVADGSLARTATELAARLAAGPTTGYGRIKESMLTAAGADLQASLEVEHQIQNELGETSDHREAVEAFVTKRNPKFTGH
ncbi:enoyl-CoA hydratase-related protein [Sciscionella sediminilitoris]|uniref:enoyl-CoA hydratase-related protein n=1 Tax=Sciscionella sediminilitoris TaxID=1445613 RepID=UPI0004DF29E0|nr:enoyl-CoA hydratase-related protein [Sciscionella sp. SE31]